MSNEIGSNPCYGAYAQAHGRTPSEMMEHDRTVWPGGCMIGFIAWMSEQKQAFWSVCPSAFIDRYTIRDQASWVEFLQSVATDKTGGKNTEQKVKWIEEEGGEG